MTIPFHDTPPRRPDRPHLPLLRLPPSANVRAAITCWELLQIDTHFIGNRTLPHVTTNCPGCDAQKPLRYEAYVSVFRAQDHKHVIYALTPCAARDLFDQTPNPHQIRGHIIDLHRNGRRSNGMVRIEVTEHMLSAEKMPAAPFLLAHLLDIWGLDQSHLGTDADTYAENVKAELEQRYPNRGS